MSALDDPRAFLRGLYDAAVQRALPAHNTAAFLPPPPAKGRTLVLGAGKAGGAMAEAVDALWPANAPLRGLVVTRYDHVPPAYREPDLRYVDPPTTGTTGSQHHLCHHEQ